MFKNNVTWLSDFDGLRDNNFTVLRLLFAWFVLWGHSFVFQKVPGVLDPISSLFQGSTWIGEIAVNGFFVISGFLVTGSLLKRPLHDYFISRVLRIYPALLVCVFLSVFVLGPLLTNLSPDDYFRSAKTYNYLWNSAAYFPMQWNLPGVFEGNYKQSVNGSLWSLTVEVRCYLLLLIFGFFRAFHFRFLANILLIGAFIFAFVSFEDVPLMQGRERWVRPLAHFFIGVAIYVNRESFPLDFRLFLGAVALFVFSVGESFFDYLTPFAFAYTIFFIAYKLPHLDVDASLGDISYGLYIYACPVQQTVAHFLPEIGPHMNAVLSTIVVLVLAILSWRLVERPLMLRKEILLRWGRLGRGR